MKEEQRPEYSKQEMKQQQNKGQREAATRKMQQDRSCKRGMQGNR